MSVVLINPFEVPAGREDEFRAAWRATAEHMRSRSGYLSTALHESIDPGAQFRFVNVAEWESPEAFRAAVSDPQFQALARRLSFATAHPSLYKVT